MVCNVRRGATRVVWGDGRPCDAFDSRPSLRGHSPPRPHPCVTCLRPGGPARAPTHTPFTTTPVPWRMKELTMRNGEVVDAEATAIGLTTDCPDCPGRVVHVEGSSWACLRCGYSTTMTLAEDTDA